MGRGEMLRGDEREECEEESSGKAGGRRTKEVRWKSISLSPAMGGDSSDSGNITVRPLYQRPKKTTV
jgi:hypothetical protein